MHAALHIHDYLSDPWIGQAAGREGRYIPADKYINTKSLQYVLKSKIFAVEKMTICLIPG